MKNLHPQTISKASKHYHMKSLLF